jgi:hypothetical protein
MEPSFCIGLAVVGIITTIISWMSINVYKYKVVALNYYPVKSCAGITVRVMANTPIHARLTRLNK